MDPSGADGREAAEQAVSFQSRLREHTPKVYWTPFLVAVNVAAFAAMVLFGGVNFLSPSAESLVRWGANFGPRTVNGEWWRLLTSTFLHVGILHLVFNMWVLAQAGPIVERLFGNTAFALVYFFSGLAGSLASVALRPLAVSAGASGAIFGVYGALLGYLALHRRALPAPIARGLGRSAVFFVGFNLVYGVSQKGIDLAAHGGGLLAGFLCGLVLSRDPSSGASGRGARIVLVAASGLGLLFAGIMGLKGSVADVAAEMERFRPIESRSIDTFNAMVHRYKSDEITGAEAARIVERDILSPWRASRESLAALRRVPPEQKKLVSRMLRYMKLREESWELFARGARENDAAAIREGNAKSAEAVKVIEEIRKE